MSRFPKDGRKRGHPRKPRRTPQGGAAPLAPERRREARLAFGVVFALATIIALLPGGPGRASLIGWDKLDHLAAFAALALLARMGWPSLSRPWLAGMLLVYGVVLEAAQAHPLVGRTASVSDMIADALGIALGLALAWSGARLARLIGR